RVGRRLGAETVIEGVRGRVDAEVDVGIARHLAVCVRHEDVYARGHRITVDRLARRRESGAEAVRSGCSARPRRESRTYSRKQTKTPGEIHAPRGHPRTVVTRCVYVMNDHHTVTTELTPGGRPRFVTPLRQGRGAWFPRPSHGHSSRPSAWVRGKKR